MKAKKLMLAVLLVGGCLTLNGCLADKMANSWVNFVDTNPIARKLNPMNMGKDEKSALPSPVQNAMGMQREKAAAKK